MSAGDDIAISLSDVEQAADRIRCFVPPTPTLESDVLNGIVGARVVFKCENLTATGAFKIRGATNALLQLDDAARERGVAAHSSGNHAGAVAKAAKRLGVPAWIGECILGPGAALHSPDHRKTHVGTLFFSYAPRSAAMQKRCRHTLWSNSN